MKPEIHPDYQEIKVTCSCGNIFKVGSVLKTDLRIEVCDQCHPFCTGKQKIIDTTGRVDRFKKQFSGFSAQQKPADSSKTDKADPKK